MTQDEIVEMAKEAGIYHAQDSEYHWDGLTDQQIIERTPDSAKDIEWRNRRTFEILERFANLVAKHTLMNIDPSKFMSCQEVMEAARSGRDVMSAIEAKLMERNT